MRDSGASSRARRATCPPGRSGAALARLRELRHVSRLQGTRRGICRRGARAAMSQTFVPARNAPAAEYDRSLAWAALLLAATGLVMVYSASIATAEENRYTGHSATWFLMRHGMFFAVALAGALMVFLVPARHWQQAAPLLFLAGMALLVAVLVPGIGREVNGARRWLALPIVSAQPSELMKLAAVLYAADYTVRKHSVLKSFKRGLLPMLAVMLVVAWLLLREPDFGALVVIAASVEKLHYLPEAHTDFLLAVLAEELGFAGVAAVIALFAWIVARAFAIAREARSRERHFAALAAQGIGIWLGAQAFINMGVNMGLLPTKGLTLPLMSYGGSGLVANFVAIAILLRIDWENRQLARGLHA